MKKFMLCTLLLGTFAFSACGSDDDGDGGTSFSECQTCTATDATVGVYCVDADGTIYLDGTSIETGDQTFAAYIQFREGTIGDTCVEQ